MRSAPSTAGRSQTTQAHHAPAAGAALPGSLTPVVLVPTVAADPELLARLLDHHPQVYARPDGLGLAAASPADARSALVGLAETAMRDAGMSLRRGTNSPLRIVCGGLKAGDDDSLEHLIRAHPQIQAIGFLRDGRDAVVESRLDSLRAVAFDGLSSAGRAAAERAAAFHAPRPGSDPGAPAALFCPESLRLHTMRWIASLRGPMRASELLREQARLLRQEDLMVETIRTHAAMCRWLGVAGDAAHVHGAIESGRSALLAAPRPGAWRSLLSEAEKVAFKRMAGELLIELGYAADTRW